MVLTGIWGRDNLCAAKVFTEPDFHLQYPFLSRGWNQTADFRHRPYGTFLAIYQVK